MKRNYTRKITVTAVLAAMAAVLMYFPKIQLPFMPAFISLDFSDLPTLICSYALGPLWGAAVCVIKNAVSLLQTQTAGIGELSNLLISLAFVVPAGLIYKLTGGKKGALTGALAGAVLSAGISVFTNYYIVYPIYANIMSMDIILTMYRAIDPTVVTLWDALLRFNLPFTFCKELISVIICFIVYKRISPLLKGTKNAVKPVR